MRTTLERRLQNSSDMFLDSYVLTPDHSEYSAIYTALGLFYPGNCFPLRLEQVMVDWLAENGKIDTNLEAISTMSGDIVHDLLTFCEEF